MPEDYKELVQEIEEFNDAQKHNLLTSYLSEDVKRLGRQVQFKLLTEFVEFLNSCYYNISNDEVMKKKIEKFLDERSKKSD